MLNLLGKGDISKGSFDHIVDLCQRYSIGSYRTSTRDRDVLTRAQNSSSGGVARVEIGNLLENFKTDMMSSISSQLDILKAMNIHVMEYFSLDIFCVKCRQKYRLRECPLQEVEVCGLCELDHNTKDCPSIPKVKVVL